MKKLRMIVTSVIVLAIVGSAFAFKMKAASFCYSTNGDTHCDAIINAQRLTTVNPTTFKYYPAWLGDPAQCTPDATSPADGLCTVNINLGSNE